MKRWVARLITPHFSYANAIERQQAQRLLMINLVSLAVLVLSAPVTTGIVFGTLSVDAWLIFLPVAVFALAATHRLIQRGQLRWARLLFVLNVVAATLLGIFPQLRIDTPVVIALTLALTAAGVLLGRNGLLSVALILAAAITLGGLIQIAVGMEFTPTGATTSDSLHATIVIVLSVIVLNTAMLWVFGRGIEDTLHRQERLARLVAITAQVSQDLAIQPDTRYELNRAVERIREALNLYHIQVFLVDSAGGQLILQASTGFIGRRLLEEASLLTPEEGSLVYQALHQADPILLLEDAPENERAGFLPATRSEALFSLRIADQPPLGVLDLHSASPDTFSSDLVEPLATLAAHLAVALHTRRMADRLAIGDEERDRLIVRIEEGQRDLARLNRQLVGVAWETYLQERAPDLDWRAAPDRPVQQTEAGVLDQTLSDGQPRLERQAGVDVLCVPIRLRGQVLGALEFHRKSDTGWSAAALELAQAVAERLALSLENARLFEQAQTTAHREQLVGQISSHLQTATTLQALLTLAAAQFQDALEATHTQVRLGLPSADSSAPQG